MRPNPIPLITILLWIPLLTFAQQDNRAYQIELQTGSFTPSENINPNTLQFINQKLSGNGKPFIVIQFEQIPDAAAKKQLEEKGIELLDYIPNNAYTATISNTVDISILQQVKARSLVTLTPEQKMQPMLAQSRFPAWAVKSPGTVDLWVSFPRSYDASEVITLLKSKNIDILSREYLNYRIIALRISTLRVNEVASLDFIEYVQPIPAPDQPLNTNTMAASRANVLKASVANGGRALDGQGVVVGVGDNGDVQSHIDLTQHLINRASEIMRAHASHVAGTIGGTGIIQELYAGYAPKATILSQVYSKIFILAPAYVRDYGMVITNNSYGTVVNDCEYNGLYDLSSQLLDQQAINLPELQNVFAGGNDGTRICPPYATGFKTLLGGYQSAKNVLTVGSTDFNGNLSSFSSRGPVRDGRLKPEIMSHGNFVASTWINNIYSYSSGTSMAAPGVSGGLALLIQRYRQLHAGANPKSALMKALLINGSTDRGNPGPDFSYGFGRMNLPRSLSMMENNRYFQGNVGTTVANNHLITVPANTAQLKVLIYWQDPPAAVMAARTLVNDLDLQVIDPSNNIILPAKLDTAVTRVANPSVNAADHINNIEQVTIDNPSAGNYTLKAIPFLITTNAAQEYYIVYDIIPQGLTLTNPVGGEAWVPTVSTLDTANIQWDDYGGPANGFKLEFSSDNGSSWTTIGDNIAASSRIFGWAVPATPTSEGRIKITKIGTALTQVSNPFTITAMPFDSLAPVQCEGYINLGWRPVPGATDYEVMMLRGDEMTPVAITTGLNYQFRGLSKDSLYWVTVRARINGKPGRRAVAVSRQPNSGTCAGIISDNDLKVDSVLVKSVGRKFTSSALTAGTIVRATIKNLDDAAANSFNVKYSLNGGPWITENVSTPLAAGSVYTHNFSTGIDLSAIGTYILKVVVENAIPDPVSINDTIVATIRQLDNAPVDYNAGLTENMETASFNETRGNAIGLPGISRFDLSANSFYGRVRPFINSGMAFSGTKALTLDVSQLYNPGNTNFLTGTFNLSGASTSTDVRLDFRYKQHDQVAHADNKVWIRGNDSSPWLEVYNLFNNQSGFGIYKRSASIELSRILIAAGQSFSSSFQVRWGQNGTRMTSDDEAGAGYSFDDIKIYTVVNDVQLVSLDTPTVFSCGLNAAVPIKITVRNSSNTAISNVPVKFNVDGGAYNTETIPLIGANSSVQFTFTATANLLQPGTHIVEAVVTYPSDSFRPNDTVSVSVMNLPMVNSFPYLQNFETNNGSWFSSGINNTWEYGTPASPRINRAASGSKAWKTRLSGYYNDSERSYLYSPCFDLSGLTNPTLSFSVALDIEDCGTSLCDGAWVEYSLDNGVSWIKLGSNGQGTNWYNKNYSGNHLWSQQNYTRWHVATIPLPVANNSKLRLRFAFASDEGVTRDGIAIDDIHIYSNGFGIYDGLTMNSAVTQPVPAANNWVNFLSSGKLVASINSKNQDLGNTSARAFINNSGVRSFNGQYYHNRNITIQPTNTSLNDSSSIRFYFLDTETELLIAANGCSNCAKPNSAYELGVSKYSDTDSLEDGSISNNTGTDWMFIPSNKVNKVPFDKGYYAEFKVRNFSEFWLNNGGFDLNHALPVELLLFNAVKAANQKDVLVSWRTKGEVNIVRYEVEVARSNEDLRLNQFIKIADLNAQGSPTTEQDYSYVDVEANKTGTRYYRLKIIDQSGAFTYSSLKPVIFTQDYNWQITSNPSRGLFYLLFQLQTTEKIDIDIMDATGRIVYRNQFTGNGFIQKVPLDLQSPKYAAGIYFLRAQSGENNAAFKLVKQ